MILLLLATSQCEGGIGLKRTSWRLTAAGNIFTQASGVITHRDLYAGKTIRYRLVLVLAGMHSVPADVQRTISMCSAPLMEGRYPTSTLVRRPASI